MRTLLLSIICLTSLMAAGCKNTKEQADEPIASEVLLSASESWKGDRYSYPQGQAQMTLKRIVFQPGAKSKPHSHDQPGIAYMVKGTLKCEVQKTGQVAEFQAGDALATTFKNELHTCENIGKEEVVVFVAYAGAEGLPLSYYSNTDDH